MKKFRASLLNKGLKKHHFIPVIGWTVLVIVLHYLANAMTAVPILGLGLLSLVINSMISYHLGKMINEKGLARYWIFFLPLAFCLAVLPLATYNLLFGLIYLIFEIFGLMEGNIYR